LSLFMPLPLSSWESRALEPDTFIACVISE
jgi:hypothetical protein